MLELLTRHRNDYQKKPDHFPMLASPEWEQQYLYTIHQLIVVIQNQRKGKFHACYYRSEFRIAIRGVRVNFHRSPTQ